MRIDKLILGAGAVLLALVGWGSAHEEAQKAKQKKARVEAEKKARAEAERNVRTESNKAQQMFNDVCRKARIEMDESPWWGRLPSRSILLLDTNVWMSDAVGIAEWFETLPELLIKAQSRVLLFGPVLDEIQSLMKSEDCKKSAGARIARERMTRLIERLKDSCSLVSDSVSEQDQKTYADPPVIRRILENPEYVLYTLDKMLILRLQAKAIENNINDVNVYSWENFVYYGWCKNQYVKKYSYDLYLSNLSNALFDVLTNIASLGNVKAMAIIAYSYFVKNICIVEFKTALRYLLISVKQGDEIISDKFSKSIVYGGLSPEAFAQSFYNYKRFPVPDLLKDNGEYYSEWVYTKEHIYLWSYRNNDFICFRYSIINGICDLNYMPELYELCFGFYEDIIPTGLLNMLKGIKL